MAISAPRVSAVAVALSSLALAAAMQAAKTSSTAQLRFRPDLVGSGSSAELPTDTASGAPWAMIRRGGEDDGRAHFAAKHKKAFID